MCFEGILRGVFFLTSVWFRFRDLYGSAFYCVISELAAVGKSYSFGVGRVRSIFI